MMGWPGTDWTAHREETLGGGALDAADCVQGLAMRLPATDVGQDIEGRLQELEQRLVVGQRRQRRRVLHLRGRDAAEPKYARVLDAQGLGITRAASADEDNRWKSG